MRIKGFVKKDSLKIRSDYFIKQGLWACYIKFNKQRYKCLVRAKRPKSGVQTLRLKVLDFTGNINGVYVTLSAVNFLSPPINKLSSKEQIVETIGYINKTREVLK